MKKTKMTLLLLIMVSIILPVICGLCFHTQAGTSPSHLPQSREQYFKKITVLDTKNNTVSNFSLEDYIVGVLAAEMPASYEVEALKAQAVAARSFILSKAEKQNPVHPQATVCTNPAHCKGFLSEKDAKQIWNEDKRDFYWEKLKSAANATKGEYMIYDNAVVEAFFFASGSGRTENSEDVWLESRPYLRSVETPETLEDSTSTSVFSRREFFALLNPHLSTPLPSNSTIIVSDITYTAGGSIGSLKLCGKQFKGTEIRSIFGLKSARFTVSVQNNDVIFSVTGHGHGVGMSQKGANQMAKEGKNYTEILSHYYTNIQIVKL